MVETGDDDTKVGRSGERSRYQISYVVWKQHQILTHKDSEWMCWYWQVCCKGEDADIVALKHIKWLDRHLPRVTTDETLFRHYALAWAWNGGLTDWSRRDKPFHVSTQKRLRCNDFATRVTNLYSEYYIEKYGNRSE